MRFGKIPLSAAKMPGTPLKVFTALSACANGNGEAWPTIETLEEYTGLKQTAIFDALKFLREESWIERNGPGRYFIFSDFDGSPPSRTGVRLDGPESPPSRTEKSAVADPYTYNRERTDTGTADLKITGVKQVSEDDDIQPRVSGKAMVKRDGLATGIAAKLEKQKEKRTALTPDAEAMADRLDALNGVTLSRTGKDRDRWLTLAREYPGAEGIALVEAAFRNFQEHPWSQWDGPCTAFRVEHFAPTWKFKNKKPQGRTLMDYLNDKQ
jgi:hypothetical protein